MQVAQSPEGGGGMRAERRAMRGSATGEPGKATPTPASRGMQLGDDEQHELDVQPIRAMLHEETMQHE